MIMTVFVVVVIVVLLLLLIIIIVVIIIMVAAIDTSCCYYSKMAIACSILGFKITCNISQNVTDKSSLIKREL